MLLLYAFYFHIHALPELSKADLFSLKLDKPEAS